MAAQERRAATLVRDELDCFAPDSEIVMVDGTLFGDSFGQDRPWDDSGTTISGI